MRISDFLNTHAHRVWTGKHLSESRAKINLFLTHGDNADKNLEDLRAPDIIDFDYWLQEERGLCKNTCNHYKAAIGALYGYAVEYGTITPDQVPRMKFHKVKSGRVRYFTDLEIKRAYDFFAGHKHSWTQHFFTIGLNTGMRLGEIQSVTPEMFKLDNTGELIVRLEDTKNGDSRDVAINEAALLAFDALDREPSKYYRHRPFYNTWADVRYTVFKGDETAVFHVTRHTYCSTLVNDLNVNEFMVMTVMGHRDPKTTKKYVHAKAGQASSINSRVNDLYQRGLSS